MTYTGKLIQGAVYDQVDLHRFDRGHRLLAVVVLYNLREPVLNRFEDTTSYVAPSRSRTDLLSLVG